MERKIEYYMGLAQNVARGSRCQKRKVGCVIVNEGRIVSTGYNFHPRGSQNDSFCLRLALAAPRDTSATLGLCIHAEMNALLFSNYSEIQGGKMFITDPPCPLCVRLVAQSGVKECHFQRGRQLSQLSASIIKLLGHGRVGWYPYIERTFELDMECVEGITSLGSDTPRGQLDEVELLKDELDLN